jgi:hypothetical protein
MLTIVEKIDIDKKLARVWHTLLGNIGEKVGKNQQTVENIKKYKINSFFSIF